MSNYKHGFQTWFASLRGRSKMITRTQFFLILAALALPVCLSAQGVDSTKIDQALGRSGEKSGNVYRVSFPRSDLHVSVHGVSIKPGLALGSWAAFSGSDDDAMVMGDLVLLPTELGPVMAKLRASGFEITGIHNHLLGETPHVMYMHYMGHGKAADLAGSLKSALAMSKTPLGKPAASAKSETEPAFVKRVESELGHQGKVKGGVLAVNVPRAKSPKMHDAELTASQGVAEALNFQEAGPGQVATTGDFVLTADEVNPVISALEDHRIEVTALHNHMLTDEPRLFFMHFWAVGSAETVGQGLKAALEKINTK
jgi:Domain of Unknown Function (DUF1259)